MEKLHYIRPALAKFFQSCERTRLSLGVLELEKARGVAKGVQRPIKYSCYNEVEGFRPTNGVICGGTIRLLGGYGGDADAGGNRIGIAVQDHVSGQMTDYYTEGLFAMQCDSGISADNLLGAKAYYIISSGLITDDSTGSGTTRIPVGYFQVETPYSRLVSPNKLTFGTYQFADVLLDQDFNNSSLAHPAASSACGCNSDCCDIFAAPSVVQSSGLIVDFAANAVNGNPAQGIGSLSWNFDGIVTNVGGVVSFAAQGFGERVSFEFPAAGTYTDVWLIVKADLGDGTSCDCANETTSETPCCRAYNLTVVVTETTAEIVSCNTVDNSTLRNWKTELTYAKTTAAQVDTFDQLNFTVSTAQAVTGNITNAGEAASAASIKAAIEAAGFVADAVVVTVSPAAADGDNQSFTIIVIGTNADLATIKVTRNGGNTASTFTVIS